LNSELTYHIIISNAKLRDPNSIKGEWHHILPKCLNGDDSNENLVKLSFREHYFCHYLLTKIYPDNSGLIFAYNVMTNDGKHGKVISSKHYERFKLKFSKINSEMSKEKFNNPLIAKACLKNLEDYRNSDRNTVLKNRWKDRNWSEFKSKQQSEYMIDQWKIKGSEISNSQQLGKSLRYMWDYLNKYNILNPTDEQILNGWKIRRGYSKNWEKYYTPTDWIMSVRNYIKERNSKFN
jgi:hypothetical protein